MIPFLIASILPLATGAQVEWRPGDLPTQARFSQPAGHLQPATARMFSVFASNADSLSLDILAAAPESLVARGDHGVFRSIGHRGFRRRSAEAGNWERPLNLDSIRSVHGGAVLRIAATAHGPRGNASIQGTWSIGSLEVIGLRTEDAFEDLAISDPSTVRPVARAVVHLCDSASSAGCIQSATDDRGFAHLAAPSGHWRAMVRNGLDVLVLGHDLAHSITPAAVSIPSPTTGWSSWKREFHDPPSPRAHGRGQSPQPGSGKGYRIHPYLARGVHRPGDSIVVGCLVRAPGGSLPTPHSLEVTLRHDTTLLVDSARASSGLEGHYQVRMALPRNIPGGTWTLWTRFDGDTSDSIVFRVETDPPRKVSVDLQDSVLMDSPTIVARLSAKWLSGRSAVGLTGRIRIVRTEKKTRGYTPGNYNSGDWILSQYRRGGPSELRLDTTFESFLDDAGRMEVRLPLHWNPYGWREAAYTLSAEVFAPGGEAIDPVERKGSIEWGREPFLHVFCDSVETILTPLMLTWAGHVALAGVPLHLRIHDPLTGSVLLDTTMESSTSIRVPTSLWVGSTPDSPLRLGRFFQANLRVVSDSSAWSSFEIETGRTRSGWWGLPRHLDQRAQSRWVLHPKPAAPSAPSSPRTATATAPRFSAPQETPSPNDAMSPGRPPLEVCWESLPGTLSLVQVTQGRRLLHQEWVRGGKDSTCWKREPPAHWWPSVVVSVHALHGSVDSGMAVQHRGERFQVSAPRGRISIAVRPLSHFQPNSVQRVRVVNHSRIAGSVVVSAIDRGTLDLDGHRTRNPAPTLEADDPPTDSWWTSIAKATDPTDAPVFHSYRTLGSHGGVNFPDIVERLLGKAAATTLVERSEPEVWISPVLALPDTGLVVEVPVGAYAGALRICAVAMAGHSATVTDTDVVVRSPLEAMWGLPAFLRPEDRTTATLMLAGPPSRDLSLRWRLDGSLEALGERSTRLALDSHGMATVHLPLVAGNRPGSARIEGNVDLGDSRSRLATKVDIHPSTAPAQPSRNPAIRLEWTDSVAPVLRDSSILVDASWQSIQGANLVPWNLAAGSDLSLVVHIRNRSSAAALDADVSLGLPAGWSFRSGRLESARAGLADADPALESRDDRVRTRFDLPSGATKEIRLRLHASHPGEYRGGELVVEIPGTPPARLVQRFPPCVVAPKAPGNSGFVDSPR